MRFITYPGTDVVVICFSVARAASLTSVINRWIPELDTYCPPTVPIVLVGTQTDLRPAATDDVHTGPATAVDAVVRHSGAKVARKIGAHSYVECSALSGEGLADVFVEAAKAALNASSSSRRRRKSCSRSSLLRHVASCVTCWRRRSAV